MSGMMNRDLEGLDPYIPGEQPTEPGWVKLNTNENPYPPAPGVFKAVKCFDAEFMRKYPAPDAAALREAIGESFGWPADGVLVTNGSDEALRMFCHAFLNPGDKIGMLWPTYSLYPILGRMFGAETLASRVGPSGEWPDRIEFEDVKLFFLANPNPPYGTLYDEKNVASIVASHPDIVFVIDAAYVEFAPGDCASLLFELDNVFITRTFSKSHALAGLRVGYVLGKPKRMRPLWVIRDSYNVNAVSQAAALAAWEDREYYNSTLEKVVGERDVAVAKLAELGFKVLPTAANFLFARHPKAPEIFKELKKRKILVRYFDSPETYDGLRITVGTSEDMAALFNALWDILSK